MDDARAEKKAVPTAAMRVVRPVAMRASKKKAVMTDEMMVA